MKESQLSGLTSDYEKGQKETQEILEAAETLEKESSKNAQIIEQLK